jgi:hypothetical protein
MCADNKMAQSTVIRIQEFDATDYKHWSLEVEILLQQEQVLGIFDGTEQVPDLMNAKCATVFKTWKEQHRIVQPTILLAMERLLQQQYGFQNNTKALRDQVKEDYKLKGMLNVWALRDMMSAVNLRVCQNVQEYASKSQTYVNDVNLSTDTNSSSTGRGTMSKS